MPFKSQAQRAKFHVLKSQGKMSQATIDEWERDTPAKLPERIGKKNKDSKHSSKHWEEYSHLTGMNKPRKKYMKKATIIKEAFCKGFEKEASIERMKAKLTGYIVRSALGLSHIGTTRRKRKRRTK